MLLLSGECVHRKCVLSVALTSFSARRLSFLHTVWWAWTQDSDVRQTLILIMIPFFDNTHSIWLKNIQIYLDSNIGKIV